MKLIIKNKRKKNIINAFTLVELIILVMIYFKGLILKKRIIFLLQKMKKILIKKVFLFQK